MIKLTNYKIKKNNTNNNNKAPSSAPQYYADANEAQSWMDEKVALMKSDHYGRDEASVDVNGG